MGALDDGRTAVVWTEDGNAGIWLRLYGIDGAPEGAAIRVTDVNEEGNRPSVAQLENGDFVVTYTSLTATTSAIMRAQIFTSAGTPVVPGGFDVAAAGSTSVAPETIALAGGGFLTVFDSLGFDGSAFGVAAQITDSARAPVGSVF